MKITITMDIVRSGSPTPHPTIYITVSDGCAELFDPVCACSFMCAICIARATCVGSSWAVANSVPDHLSALFLSRLLQFLLLHFQIQHSQDQASLKVD
jgi:hypothetical protein